MAGYYTGSKIQPYHLSVGAVVINNEGEICAHYFENVKVLDKEYTDLYILMKETLRPGETFEEGCSRGLMEEFGMVGTIRGFLGSLQSTFHRPDAEIQKTTLYFLVDYVSHDESKRSLEDVEGGSKITWNEPEYLIQKMIEQDSRIPGSDESEMIKRAVALRLPK